uniref:Uncharacterized protein n=1 Tax=Anguilla anguilla TaxID=7936 RepID=A0A0E9TVR0_ANGAN
MADWCVCRGERRKTEAGRIG